MKSKVKKYFSNMLIYLSILILSFPFFENRIKVSIIVPVYNAESYLAKTLDSITNQTMKEIEIICVNDGSEDNSLKILEEYRSKDNRIKIIDQKNAGVSVARNLGIKAAQGKYISFMDADDLIAPNLYECVYGTAERYGAEVTKFGHVRFVDGEKQNLEPVKYNKSKINLYTRRMNENPYRKLEISCDCVWDKLWNREFLIKNDLRFAPGIANGEDILFCWESFLSLQKAVNDENVFYYFRQRKVSFMSVATTEDHVKSHLEVTRYLMKLRGEYLKFEGGDVWLFNRIYNWCYSYIMSLDSLEKRVKYAKELFQIIDEPFLNNIREEIEENKINELKELKKISEYEV